MRDVENASAAIPEIMQHPEKQKMQQRKEELKRILNNPIMRDAAALFVPGSPAAKFFVDLFNYIKSDPLVPMTSRTDLFKPEELMKFNNERANPNQLLLRAGKEELLHWLNFGIRDYLAAKAEFESICKSEETQTPSVPPIDMTKPEGAK